MTEKFEATLGTREPKTEALRKLRKILMGMMGVCADALNRFDLKGQLGTSHYRDESVSYYRGQMDGFASCLGLLDTLGKQIEEDAFEQGYQLGQEQPKGHSYDR